MANPVGPNWYSILNQRSQGALSKEASTRGLSFGEGLARRLSLEAVMRGHQGCVNRLAWNAQGTMLASGSDDKQILLWWYPETHRAPLAVDTHHSANIFGVRFLPATGDRQLVSGAMDHTVQLHTLEAAPDRAKAPARQRGGLRRHPDTATLPAPAHTTMFACHKGRVKDVEVEPQNPHLFWSASEDSTVRQFDLRCSTDSQRDFDSPNVLLSVRHHSRHVEVKGVAINKALPHQLAVAAGDCYVRVYDRRMLSTGPVTSPSVVAAPMLQMAPPHLLLPSYGARAGVSRPHSTYVGFGSRGDRLVATYHGDHAYAFDVSGAAQPPTATFAAPAVGTWGSSGSEGGLASASSSSRTRQSWARGDELRAEGNQAVQEGNVTGAIRLYTQGLQHSPRSALLYSNRAQAYLKRDWVGDPMFALADAEAALALDPAHAKSHKRRISALRALGELQAAATAANEFRAQAPQAEDEAIVLKEEVLAEMRQRREAHARRRRGEAASARRRQESWSLLRDSPSPGSNPPPPPPNPPAADTTTAAEFGPTVSEPVPEVPPASSRPLGTWAGAGGGGGGDEESDWEERHSEEEDERPSTDFDVGESLSGAAAELESGAAGPSGRRKLQDDPGALWRTPGGRRMLQRFVGHCNVQTDIKEAVYLGRDDGLVACGSDDGLLFIYNAASGEPIRVLQADEDVCNCVQAHPHLPLLATSGIESVVRLWSPAAEAEVSGLEPLVARNQELIKQGPQSITGVSRGMLQQLTENPELLSLLVRRMGARGGGGGEEDGDEGEATPQELSCRVN